MGLKNCGFRTHKLTFRTHKLAPVDNNNCSRYIEELIGRAIGTIKVRRVKKGENYQVQTKKGWISVQASHAGAAVDRLIVAGSYF